MPVPLNEPMSLDAAVIEHFRREGFIKIKDVLSPDVIEEYAEVITRVTLDNDPNKDTPIEERDTYGKAFIQVGNLWRRDEKVAEFTFSARLAHIASQLLGTDGVRLWHDQALYKEPGGGFTPWHADQHYWPMATGKSVTAWIPLQATPIEMGPLCFAKGSHLKNVGRDIAISDDSERVIREEIARHKLIEVYEPYELGEVSFHLGWTLHRAGPNTTGQPRKVHTVIYMDREMRLAEPRNENQQADWEAWTPSTQIGEVMDDALNPVLYPPAEETDQ